MKSDDLSGREICVGLISPSTPIALCASFTPHLIVRDYVHIINGTEVRVPRGKPTLRPDAVPTILPNVPSFLTKKTPAPRPLTKRRQFTSDNDGERKRRRIDRGKVASSDERATAATENNEAGEAIEIVGTT